jgi:hypothetical protein
MSKACMNVNDLAGIIYDGCRITKGKDVLFFGNLNQLQDILVYHFGITDLDRQSNDEKYYESLLPESFKVDISFNTKSQWFQKNINYLVNLELRAIKNKEIYKRVAADLSLPDKFTKLLDVDNWMAYLETLCKKNPNLLTELNVNNVDELSDIIRPLMIDEVEDALDEIRQIDDIHYRTRHLKGISND